MSRTVGGILVLLLALPAAWADDKPKDKPMTPEEQYKALLKDYQDAMTAFQEAYPKAKTQEERNKVFEEKYPRPEKFAPKFVELAEQNPKDPVAVDALSWVVMNDRGGPGGKDSPRNKALALLGKEYVQSDKLANVCQRLGYNSDNESADLLRAVLDKNPNKDVQGAACLSLGRVLKTQAERGPAAKNKDEADKLRKESEQLFERAADKYADVKLNPRLPSVGDQAKGELFELRFLVIGKEVPDVEGEDADSKKFKLSDYRGKVVMIDFWGHW
jgi:hypothetical protein